MMEVQIGLLFSLTGTTALTEKGQCEMAQFAVHEFNQKQGKEKVKTIVMDIASDPDQTVKAAESLARQGIKIFIGCYTSACRKAVLPVLEKYNCLLVYPTLYEGRECHSHVFYTGEVPNQQVFTMLDYMTQHYGKRVYCVGTDYIYPRETHQQVKSYMKEKQGEIVGEEYVPFGHRQFYEILHDINRKQPDAIFLTLVGTSVVHFYRTYQEMKFSPDKLPIFSPITKETEIKAIGARYAAGHYSSASYFQSLGNRENIKLIKKFKQYSNSHPLISSVMFNTYLGTKLILDAVFRAKSLDYHALFYELDGVKLETACGTVETAENVHHLSRPLRIGKAREDGQFSIVWDSHHAIPPKPFSEKMRRIVMVEKESLNTWGKVSNEALLILSQQNEIVYLTEKAKEITNFKGFEILSARTMKHLHEKFDVYRYEAQNQYILLLSPKRLCNTATELIVFHNIRTRNPAYQKELEIAKLAAESTSNVLILGETGTGKEMLAKAIHHMSERKTKPFIAVNAGMIPKELVASELFGFVEGAFTGAKRGGAIGKFEAADGGTLFLDEIGEMPLDVQVSLLRAIDTGSIMRLGDYKERKVDARIIAATNRNLPEEIAYNRSFRSDLYYRLNVLSITIPPLRERPEDIEHLALEFVSHFHKQYDNGPITIHKTALDQLAQYPWPGNIRELRNVIERAFLMGRKKLSDEIYEIHLPRDYTDHFRELATTNKSLKKVEREMIMSALQEAQSISEASKKLGIARSTLYRKMKEFQLK